MSLVGYCHIKITNAVARRKEPLGVRQTLGDNVCLMSTIIGSEPKTAFAIHAGRPKHSVLHGNEQI